MPAAAGELSTCAQHETTHEKLPGATLRPTAKKKGAGGSNLSWGKVRRRKGSYRELGGSLKLQSGPRRAVPEHTSDPTWGEKKKLVASLLLEDLILPRTVDI